jgi:nucleoid-associated protein YgaU
MTDDKFNLSDAIKNIKDKREKTREKTDIDRLDIGEKDSGTVFSKPAKSEAVEERIKSVIGGRSESRKAAVSKKLDEVKARVGEMEKRDLLKSQASKNAISEHIVVAGETLSAIALKYYGKATPPYYQHIYKHNREVIGENINLIIPGQKLVIPELPEDLK